MKGWFEAKAVMNSARQNYRWRPFAAVHAYAAGCSAHSPKLLSKLNA